MLGKNKKVILIAFMAIMALAVGGVYVSFGKTAARLADEAAKEAQDAEDATKQEDASKQADDEIQAPETEAVDTPSDDGDETAPDDEPTFIVGDNEPEAGSIDFSNPDDNEADELERLLRALNGDTTDPFDEEPVRTSTPDPLEDEPVSYEDPAITGNTAGLYDQTPYAPASATPVSQAAAASAPASVSDMLAWQAIDSYTWEDYPASIDPTATYPFENLTTDDISAAYVQYPLVGTIELTDDEVADLVGTLRWLKASEEKVVPYYWEHDSDNSYRFYVDGANGERWCLDALCSIYKYDSLTMAIMFGDDLATGFGRASMKELRAVYKKVWSRMGEELPQEMAPFYNLSVSEIAKAEYFSWTELYSMDASRVAELVDVLNNVVISPKTGNALLLALVGVNGKGDGTTEQFLITFTNGQTLTVGFHEGVVIGGIRYANASQQINSFYKSIFGED